MNASFFHDMLGSIAERGRSLLERAASRPDAPAGAKAPETLEFLSRSLLSGRGEASGVALARQLLDRYASEPMPARIEFFRLLAQAFDPDIVTIGRAWDDYRQEASPTNLQSLLEAVEPPRQELFRRLNLAPGGTAALVSMREDLIKHGGKEPELRKVDDDFAHLFGSWFNRGFLIVRPIDWSTPADILERIIRYEAVHEIQGWDDLRRRVQPSDRRCFAFFHPSLVDEPLIFVEVALTREIPASIQGLLAEEREVLPVGEATTAVFYSISNCQPGLRGVSFGNFLIKQVVEELSRELPSLTTFVTLSPVPGFAAWVAKAWNRLVAEIRLAPGHGNRGAGTRRAPAVSRRLLSHGQGIRRQAGRPGGALPFGQWRPPRAPQLARRYVGQGSARGTWPDGELSLRPAFHRNQPRGVRQRGHDRGLRRRPSPPACPGDRRMNENLFETFRRGFPADLGRVFLERPDGSVLSHADLLDLSGRVAQVLLDLGVKPGDRVAAQVEKSAEALMLYLGCLRAGAVYLPLNTAYTMGEIRYFLGDAEPTLFVCRPELEEQMVALGRELSVPHVLTLGEHGDGSLWAKVQSAVSGDVDVPRSTDDLAAFLYTSGTTGRSKGAMLSHGNLASNAAALRDAWRFTADDRLLHALPIFHTHGLFVATNITLMAGGSLIYLPRFDLADMMRLLPKATTMMGVPTFYTRLLSRPDFTRELVAHMRLFVSGSAPLSAETHKEFSARTGHAILERYGMTETNMNTSNPYDGDRIPGSVGQPLPGVEIRITDPETGAVLPQGGSG